MSARDENGTSMILLATYYRQPAVAQLFVTRYPERVRTMLLTNCDVEPDSPPPAVLPVILWRRVLGHGPNDRPISAGVKRILGVG